MDAPNVYEEIYSSIGSAPWTYPDPHPELVRLVNSGELRSEGTVLEIGCGEGTHALFLASRGFKVTALDSSTNAIEYAKIHASRTGSSVDFTVADHNKLPDFKNLDFIFDWRFLHILTDETARQQYIESIAQALAPNGKYLSVAFSGDKEFWGTGTLRSAPAIKAPRYWATVSQMRTLIAPKFDVIEEKLITTPYKPDLEIPCYFIFCNKRS